MKYLKTCETYFEIEWKIQEIMDWFKRNRVSKVDFTQYDFEPVESKQITEHRIITIQLESIYRQDGEFLLGTIKKLSYPRSAGPNDSILSKAIFKFVPTIFPKEGYKTILKQLESLTQEQIDDIRASEEAEKFNF